MAHKIFNKVHIIRVLIPDPRIPKSRDPGQFFNPEIPGFLIQSGFGLQNLNPEIPGLGSGPGIANTTYNTLHHTFIALLHYLGNSEIHIC